jgi:hypothetical protein
VIPGYVKTAEYRVRLDLKEGEAAPSASDLMNCIQVGAEAAPQDAAVGPFLDNLDVLALELEPSARSAVDSIIAAYEDALTTHIYDEGNGEKVPPEEWTLIESAQSEVAYLRAALGRLVERHDSEPSMLTDAEWSAARAALNGQGPEGFYRLDDAEHATVLAALRYWQQEGMGEPHNRAEDLHDIATNGGQVMSSLDDAGIDALCERLNMAG